MPTPLAASPVPGAVDAARWPAGRIAPPRCRRHRGPSCARARCSPPSRWFPTSTCCSTSTQGPTHSLGAALIAGARRRRRVPAARRLGGRRGLRLRQPRPARLARRRHRAAVRRDGALADQPPVLLSDWHLRWSLRYYRPVLRLQYRGGDSRTADPRAAFWLVDRTRARQGLLILALGIGGLDGSSDSRLADQDALSPFSRALPSALTGASTGRSPGRSCVRGARPRPSGGAADTAGTSDRPVPRAAPP